MPSGASDSLKTERDVKNVRGGAKCLWIVVSALSGDLPDSKDFRF